MAILSPKSDTKTLAKCAGSDNEWKVNYEPLRHLTEADSVAPRSVIDMPRVSWRGQRPIVDRFWARVEKNGPVPSHCPELGPCWMWTGCVVARYGQIALGHHSTPGSKRWKTHRFSWELHRGPVPVGLRVCHKCDTPLCVNPDHLFLGTQKANVHDAIQKGRRNAFGRQKLTPEDVRVIRQQAQRGILHREIAQAFGLARHTVTDIVNRRSWTHLPDAPVASDRAS